MSSICSFVILFNEGNMILIKDRHPYKWLRLKFLLEIGKYDTYKGSTHMTDHVL